MYPCFQGNVSNTSLLFPLIRPRKVEKIKKLYDICGWGIGGGFSTR